MKIGFFGASSNIAKDLIANFGSHDCFELFLFSTNIESLKTWLVNNHIKVRFHIHEYSRLNDQMQLDLLINFVGVGDPAKAVDLGRNILDITLGYDTLAIEYLKKRPACKYIFLSSGAIFGENFERPIDGNTTTLINASSHDPQDWYGLAKLNAEIRHRSMNEFAIVDIRLFNYISHRQNLDSRFLIADIFRAIRDQVSLKVSAEYMVRDFLHPSDFYALILAILNSPRSNLTLDAYTKEPIDKPNLLSLMKENFNFQYEFDDISKPMNATGKKCFYYSLNRSAEKLGYAPLMTSAEGILTEARAYLRGNTL